MNGDPPFTCFHIDPVGGSPTSTRGSRVLHGRRAARNGWGFVRPPAPLHHFQPLRHRADGVFSVMHTLIVRGVRVGFCLFLCAVVAGCAVDLGTYPPAQSVEAAVQTVLAKQGYYQGPIDGTVGPATSRAIRNYQRDHRLTATGTINPALLASMGGQPNAVIAPGYYSGYAGYSPWYAAPTYYAPPAVIGLGWGGGWGGWGGGCWNRGWGGGWNGGYGRGWCR